MSTKTKKDKKPFKTIAQKKRELLRVIPVFVYGTLRKGYYNHRLLQYAQFEADAVTVNKYAMYAHSYPMVTRNVQETSITGELFFVTDEEFKELDRLEGYPNFYDREMIKIKTAEGIETDAWMYFYDNVADNTQIDAVPSGDFTDYKEAM